jgi:hypothetical protein
MASFTPIPGIPQKLPTLLFLPATGKTSEALMLAEGLDFLIKENDTTAIAPSNTAAQILLITDSLLLFVLRAESMVSLFNYLPMIY